MTQETIESVVSGDWDVVIVGAGPAGAMAAHAAATAGARTLLLERYELPRRKLCGGGLIGASLRSLPTEFEVPRLDETRVACVSFEGHDLGSRASESAFIIQVDRAQFDAQLVDTAVAAGAVLRAGVAVESAQEHADHVLLSTSAGPVRARAVIGCDGSAGRMSRVVGASFEQVDLGIEYELAADKNLTQLWRSRILLDFGSRAGGYAWVFPKGERLMVGAIAAKGNSDWERGYLDRVQASAGLAEVPIVHSEGHLTRCRAVDSPLGRDRLLLAGDAAGLLEPWTREGISFALRSGRAAGECAAELASTGDTAGAQAAYAAALSVELIPEMDFGRQAYRAYRAHPRLFAWLIASTGIGWKAFTRLSSGESSMSSLGRHRLVRIAVRMLGR